MTGLSDEDGGGGGLNGPGRNPRKNGGGRMGHHIYQTSDEGATLILSDSRRSILCNFKAMNTRSSFDFIRSTEQQPTYDNL